MGKSYVWQKNIAFSGRKRYNRTGVSKRTLCSDIGKKLGWGAYMSALTRTASGYFKLENAVKLDELKSAVKDNTVSDFIISPENVLIGYKKVTVSQKASKYLYNGGKIYSAYFTCSGEPKQGETVLGYDSEEKLVGIYAGRTMPRQSRYIPTGRCRPCRG